MEGLRQRATRLKKKITVTDIRPGFVDTAMATGDVFWMSPVDKAARQIFKAIRNKQSVVYITKRWRLVAFIFRVIPGFLYRKM
jgi:short-subunit dehydrogenase